MPISKYKISTDPYSFDYRLRLVMELKDLNCSQLAKLSGLSTVAVCRFCNGETLPHYSSLVGLCEVLGCDGNFLLGLTDNLSFRY